MGSWKRKHGKISMSHDGQTVIIRKEKVGDVETGKFEVVHKTPGVRGFNYKIVGVRAHLESAKNMAERALLGQKNK